MALQAERLLDRFTELERDVRRARPIKHSRTVRDAHRHFRRFTNYGDARGYKQRLPRLRRSL